MDLTELVLEYEKLYSKSKDTFNNADNYMIFGIKNKDILNIQNIERILDNISLYDCVEVEKSEITYDLFFELQLFEVFKKLFMENNPKNKIILVLAYLKYSIFVGMDEREKNLRKKINIIMQILVKNENIVV